MDGPSKVGRWVRSNVLGLKETGGRWGSKCGYMRGKRLNRTYKEDADLNKLGDIAAQLAGAKRHEQLSLRNSSNGPSFSKSNQRSLSTLSLNGLAKVIKHVHQDWSL